MQERTITNAFCTEAEQQDGAGTALTDSDLPPIHSDHHNPVHSIVLALVPDTMVLPLAITKRRADAMSFCSTIIVAYY